MCVLEFFLTKSFELWFFETIIFEFRATPKKLSRWSLMMDTVAQCSKNRKFLKKKITNAKYKFDRNMQYNNEIVDKFVAKQSDIIRRCVTLYYFVNYFENSLVFRICNNTFAFSQCILDGTHNWSDGFAFGF